MGYATILGLKASAVVALVDIMIIKRIKDRRAQIARCRTCTCTCTCTRTCTCSCTCTRTCSFTCTCTCTCTCRFAYFTIPLTSVAAGWMGGVEIGKLALGRDSEVAHLAGATVPGGIVGIWTKYGHNSSGT